nr:MAG TPA: hypothetical protein [Caudoviricetes sp.]
MTYEKTWNVGVDIRLCYGVLNRRVMVDLAVD